MDRADLDRYSILGSLADNPYLDDGDVVQVPMSVHTIVVFGEVTRAGTFEFRSGDRLSGIIALAGGTRAGADTDSVELWRFLSPTESRRLFFSLRTVLADPPGAPEDPVLEPDDRIYVRQKPGWHRSATVLVAGEAVHPGAYSIPPQGQKASELVARFGGFTIYGAVRRPGAVAYRPGARLEEYVRDAGGYGERADRGKVRVTKRATGQPMRLADASSIDDGDLVWVPERERVSFIKAVGSVTGFLAQVATVYLVIHQATK